jgi:predicted DsbA family dithiol-disulfide isomerase
LEKIVLIGCARVSTDDQNLNLQRDALDGAGSTYSQAVDVDWDKSQELGIMVAPTYLMNKAKLSGSQPYEKLEELMIANNIPKKSMT